MKQQRKKDAKAISIDRTGLSVCSYAPSYATGELEKIGIVYNDTLSAVVLPAPKLQGDNHG
jgi:hypothetical protein